MTNRSKKLRTLLTLFLFLSGFLSPVWSAPGSPTVVAGSATINQTNPSATIINQSTSNAIINWAGGFSTGASESVTVNQNAFWNALLNRDLSGNVTQYNGSLFANGRVFIENANGVVFGKTAQVNVAGLFASTYHLADNDFMNGVYNFQPTGINGASVINQGTIIGKNMVVLSGDTVNNSGSITSLGGQIALTAGAPHNVAIDSNTGVLTVSPTSTFNSANSITNSGNLTVNTNDLSPDSTPEGRIILNSNGDINLVQGSKLDLAANPNTAQAWPFGTANLLTNSLGNTNVTFANVVASGQNSVAQMSAGGNFQANNSHLEFDNSGDRIHDNGSATIRANNITLETTSVVQNSGANLNINAANDINIGVSKVLASNSHDLNITAGHDLNVANSAIFHQVGQNTNITAGHDINTNTMIFKTNNDGNLNIASGNNALFNLSEINAQNGGDINVTGNNVTFNNTQLTASARNNITIGATNDFNANQSTFTIISSGNFHVNAGHDLNASESSFSATGPTGVTDFRLTAGNNETLDEVTISNVSPNSNTIFTAGNNLKVTSSTITTTATQNNTSGSNTLFTAGGNILIQSSTITANGVGSTSIGGHGNAGPGELDIAGGGTVTIANSNISTTNMRDNTTINGAGGLTIQNSQISATNSGDTLLTSGGQETISQSKVAVTGGRSFNITAPNIGIDGSTITLANAPNSDLTIADNPSNGGISIHNSTIEADNSRNLTISGGQVVIDQSTIQNNQGLDTTLQGFGQLDITRSTVAINGGRNLNLWSGNQVGMGISQSNISSTGASGNLWLSSDGILWLGQDNITSNGSGAVTLYGRGDVSLYKDTISNANAFQDLTIQGGANLWSVQSSITGNNIRDVILAVPGTIDLSQTIVSNTNGRDLATYSNSFTASHSSISVTNGRDLIIDPVNTKIEYSKVSLDGGRKLWVTASTMNGNLVAGYSNFSANNADELNIASGNSLGIGASTVTATNTRALNISADNVASLNYDTITGSHVAGITLRSGAGGFGIGWSTVKATNQSGPITVISAGPIWLVNTTINGGGIMPALITPTLSSTQSTVSP